eukprot:jgi/Tetstr1/438337/TSEL_026904.t1
MEEPSSLVALCSGSSVQLWDLEKLSRSPLSVAHGGEVTSCCWNSLGKVVASVGGYDHLRLTMWNGALIDKVATEAAGPATCLAFSRGNKYCAIGYGDGSLPIWDLKRKVVSAKLTGHRGRVTSVLYSPGEGHYLASSSLAGDVLLHSAKEASLVGNLAKSATAAKLALSFSSLEASQLASAGQDGVLCVYDTAARITKAKLQAHEGAAADLAFSCASASELYSVGQSDARLVVSDIRAKKVTQSVQTGHQLTCVAARNDGVWLAAGTQGGRLLLYDTRALQEPLHSVSVAAKGAPVTRIAFQPCERGRVAGTASAPAAHRAAQPSAAAETPLRQIPASPWLATASPMPTQAGISPLGNGLSSFTPLQSAGMTGGSLSAMRSGRHTPRVPEAEMDLRNKAAARQAQSLYGSAAAKKPAAAIPPSGAKQAAGSGPPQAAKAEAPAAAQGAAVRLEVQANLGPSPETPKMMGRTASGAAQDNKENESQAGAVPGKAPPTAERPTTAAARQAVFATPGRAGARGGGRHGGGSSGELTLGAVKGLLDERVEGLQEDVRNLHVELLRQFHTQQSELMDAFQVMAKQQEALHGEVAHLRQQLQQANRRQAETHWI